MSSKLEGILSCSDRSAGACGYRSESHAPFPALLYAMPDSCEWSESGARRGFVQFRNGLLGCAVARCRHVRPNRNGRLKLEKWVIDIAATTVSRPQRFR